MSRRVQFWKRSPSYASYHRIQRLGAFAKWARENPDERARVEARHAERKRGNQAV